MINKLLHLLASPAKDKILHCFIGYVIFDLCLAVCEAFSFNDWQTYEIAFLVILAFIFGKEVYDNNQPKNKFDWKDIYAGLIGVGIKFIIHLI